MVTVTADGPIGLSASIDVTITVTNVTKARYLAKCRSRVPSRRTTPLFAAATDTREVAENTAAGENIGAPVAATDAEDDSLTYMLGGVDMADFDIDEDTGQLMTKTALDYETEDTYTITVTASDSGGIRRQST